MTNNNPIRIVKFKDGCEVNLGHHLNHDGYWRKNTGDGPVMMHRYFWEKEHGKIPKGYTVHHKCGNRACLNTDHMELITKSEHASITNKERYAERNKKAKNYWKETKCTGTHLADKFNVSISAACKWIRDWKETH